MLPPRTARHRGVEVANFTESDDAAAILKRIETWRSGDSQFLYIGSHGVFVNKSFAGIGPTKSNFLSVNSLANALCDVRSLPAINVWLGNCKSSDVVPEFNVVLQNCSQPKVTELVSFKENVSPSTCLETLTELANGILGIGNAKTVVHGQVINSPVILTKPIDQTISELRKRGGDFESLELYFAHNGKVLSLKNLT